MPRAFTEHERTVIGKRLLQQGYRQFSAYGLAKTNVEEIAKAAGISKGAFYIFYESKEALFMDVIEAGRNTRPPGVAGCDRSARPISARPPFCGAQEGLWSF